MYYILISRLHTFTKTLLLMWFSP